MNLRIHALTLLAITLGLAPLSGCDEELGLGDGSGESGSESAPATGFESESGSESGLETGTETGCSEAGEEPVPAEPPRPNTAERLVSTPDDELAVSTPVNLALGRPASQSSTFVSGGANLAVDGNRDGYYWNGSVIHTDNGGENWWQVDLQGVEPVGEVVIWNRTDCCADRLHDFTVYVSADGVNWEGFPFAGVAGARARVLIDRPARWVKISNPGVINVAEVEVFRTRNLAYGKPAWQSSTYHGGDPGRAVDGNTNGLWWNNSVTHTGYGGEEWWQVDLGSVQALGQAVLFNRTDCCAERLHDFKIGVSNDGQSWFDIPFSGVAGEQVVIPINREGRYVRVQNGGGPLQLAEVQLFEAPRLPGLSYGRGVGTVPGYGCGPGDEQNGLLCYPLCAGGYYGNGPVCWQTCAPGFTDMGAYCMNYSQAGWPSYWKHSYGRGAGTVLVPACGAGQDHDAGLCYPKCELGYKGVGPVCWLEGVTIESIAKEACDALRVPFLSSIASDVDRALTAGVGLGLSAFATASAELGVAYGADGEFGCYVTGCAGFTTSGLGLSAYVTGGLYNSFDDIAGHATVVSGGVGFGIPETPISIGGALGKVFGPAGEVGTTISASVGLSEPSPIELAVSGLTCDTAVLQTQQ